MKTVKEISYVGIDCGGTKTAGILMLENGNILHEVSVPTLKSSSENVLRTIKSVSNELIEFSKFSGYKIEGLGLGIAGYVDTETSTVIDAPNLPLRRIPIGRLIGSEIKVDVRVENDANAAALGEVRRGAAVGSKFAVMLTLGTGVGGGIVIDDRIYHGTRGKAAEFGHIIVNPTGPICGCGARGCLESIASGTAIENFAKSIIESNRSEMLTDSYSDGVEIDAELVYKLFMKGDDACMMIFKNMGRFLGIGISSIVNSLNPDAVVIGGSISKARDAFHEEMMRSVKENSIPTLLDDVRIVYTGLEGLAGLVGAAELCLRK